MPDTAKKPYACRHIFTDGHQCGSPALRGELLCYYHNAARRPIKKQIIDGCAPYAVLPEPTDLHAVQRGLCEVVRLLAAGSIPPPVASSLLRALAIASQNLARIDRQTAAAHKANPDRKVTEDYVLHPDLGTIAPAPEDQPEPESRPEGPLPAPFTPFTLEPQTVYVQSADMYAKGQQAYAEALHQLAADIHRRAQKRAANHAALYPLHDDTAADRHELDLRPELRPYLQSFEDFGLPEQLPESTSQAHEEQHAR